MEGSRSKQIMHKEGDEVHLDEDEARSGSTPHIVRYVLAISLFLAIVLLSAIWMTGAIMKGNSEEEARMSGTGPSAEAEPGSDGLNSAEDFEFESEPVAEGEGDEATRTIPNPATE
jgi:hypothetical protein